MKMMIMQVKMKINKEAKVIQNKKLLKNQKNTIKLQKHQLKNKKW